MRTIIEMAILSTVCYFMLLLIKSQINQDMYFTEIYHKIQTINRKIRRLQFLNDVTAHNTKLELTKCTEETKRFFQKGKFNEKGYQFLMQEVASIVNYINNKLKEQNAIINRNTK